MLLRVAYHVNVKMLIDYEALNIHIGHNIHFHLQYVASSPSSCEAKGAKWEQDVTVIRLWLKGCYQLKRDLCDCVCACVYVHVKCNYFLHRKQSSQSKLLFLILLLWYEPYLIFIRANPLVRNKNKVQYHTTSLHSSFIFCISITPSFMILLLILLTIPLFIRFSLLWE